MIFGVWSRDCTYAKNVSFPILFATASIKKGEYSSLYIRACIRTDWCITATTWSKAALSLSFSSITYLWCSQLITYAVLVQNWTFFGVSPGGAGGPIVGRRPTIKNHCSITLFEPPILVKKFVVGSDGRWDEIQKKKKKTSEPVPQCRRDLVTMGMRQTVLSAQWRPGTWNCLMERQDVDKMRQVRL